MKENETHWSKITPPWLSAAIAALALFATITNTYFSYSSFNLNRAAQRDNLKTSVFSQFQQQYSAVNSRFPSKLLDPQFRPERGSDDYYRLEAYWIFCFSEWYATQRINPVAFGDLWDSYYAPLIQNALDIPSLRYALENMITNYPLSRADWREFFLVIAKLARDGGHPLDPKVEQRLYKAG